MKALYPVLLALTIGCGLQGQSHESALSFGFNTHPSKTCVLSDGRILVTGRGEVLPGQLYNDTLFALIFDPDGQVQQRLVLSASFNERHDINDAVSTPDGGFVVSISDSNCDVGPSGNALLGYDSAGVLRWELLANVFQFDFLPSKLEVGPGGEPVGIVDNGLVAYDYLTGGILWEAPANGLNIFDLDFIPGSWDFAAVGQPNLQIWHQTGTPGQPVYTQVFAYQFPSFHFYYQVMATAHGLFAIDFYNEKCTRFDQAPPTHLFESAFHQVVGMARADTGIWLNTRNNDQNWLFHLLPDGQIADTLYRGDVWRWGEWVNIADEKLIMTGTAGSGPESELGMGNDPYAYDAANLWWHSSEAYLPVAPVLPDATISLVEQQSAVDVNMGFSTATDPPTPVYKLKGGDFRVQITNNGEEVVNQVDVMILFDWIQNFFICGMKASKRIHYDSLDLAPGESAWLDFGDIDAPGQLTLPSQFCFWTAAPNSQPDADHNNDTYCHTYTTDAPEPVAAGALRISPNPAGAEGFRVERTDEVSEPLVCKLFDATGRLVACERMAPGISRLHFSTAHLPPGMYYCEAGYWRGKLVVGR